MVAIQSKQDSFPMDLAMRIRLAELVNPEIFKDPMHCFHNLTFENILKTEVLEAKDKDPHVAAQFHVAVHFERAMRWTGKGKLRKWEERRTPKEQLIRLSREFIVVTREDITLPPIEVIRGMKYTFHANVLLMKRYSVLTKAMDLPVQKHMTEKQKALREKKRAEIFYEMKSLFSTHGIWLFFTAELEKKV